MILYAATGNGGSGKATPAAPTPPPLPAQRSLKYLQVRFCPSSQCCSVNKSDNTYFISQSLGYALTSNASAPAPLRAVYIDYVDESPADQVRS
jgi:hypothetical protein